MIGNCPVAFHNLFITISVSDTACDNSANGLRSVLVFRFCFHTLHIFHGLAFSLLVQNNFTVILCLSDVSFIDKMLNFFRE